MSMSGPLVLHQFPPAFGLPISESPPCAKVEAYLRLTKIPYTVAPGDIRRSPNKLVPYIRWPDGTLQGESGDIIARLEGQAQLNAALDERLRGLGEPRALRSDRESLANARRAPQLLNIGGVDASLWGSRWPCIKTCNHWARLSY